MEALRQERFRAELTMRWTSNPTVAASWLAAVVVLSGVGVLTPGCEQAPPTSATTKRPADKVYPTRGRITSLPVPGKAMSELRIRHEPIDDFENPDGSRGMAAMEMPFVAAPEVSLGGLNVKDVVEFDLAVWYAPGKKTIESYRVTRVKRLPGDTTLRTGAATPTLGEPASGGTPSGKP